jgi:hypothetical protein
VPLSRRRGNELHASTHYLLAVFPEVCIPFLRSIAAHHDRHTSPWKGLAFPLALPLPPLPLVRFCVSLSEDDPPQQQFPIIARACSCSVRSLAEDSPSARDPPSFGRVVDGRGGGREAILAAMVAYLIDVSLLLGRYTMEAKRKCKFSTEAIVRGRYLPGCTRGQTCTYFCSVVTVTVT